MFFSFTTLCEWQRVICETGRVLQPERLVAYVLILQRLVLVLTLIVSEAFRVLISLAPLVCLVSH